MNNTTHRLSFFALLAALVSASYGVNYMWLTDQELPVFGGASLPLDTAHGPVHSNSQIAIIFNPVFYDLVTQAGQWDDFWHGSGYNPQFLGPDPIFHAIPVEIPETLYYYRGMATHYYDPGPYWQMRCRIVNSSVTMWTWPLGIAFDSAADWLTWEDFEIVGSTSIFTETSLELMGTDIIGDVAICSAQLIRIMDDVRVGGPHSGPPEYRVSENNPNFVVIASEGEIKIANTPANGRENSNGLGFSQTDPDFTDVVINAALYAIGGSFTFENQNDPDSGYVCDCIPDDRGWIYLYGALTQDRRGYTHRSNNQSTGYARQIRYDERLRTRRNVVIDWHVDFGEPMDTLDFGDVIVGTAVWDTAEIVLRCFGELGGVMATTNYYAVRIPPFYGMHFRVPVRFIPPHVGSFPGVLTVQTSVRAFQIPLRGRGVEEGGPQIAAPNAYPNPFNATTRFTFAMQTAGNVMLEVYDLQGRRVASLLDEWKDAGSHQVNFDATNLPSGLYMARLRMADQERNMKLLLVK